MPDPHTVITGAFTRTYYTVTSLPPAASMQGEVLYVTDLATNPLVSSGVVATGGGSTRGGVLSDGTNWRVYGYQYGS